MTIAAAPAADITSLITVESLDLQLFVCTELLKLPSLHYGFWPADASPRWADLPAAQARFTEHLIASMPAGVRTVLDVGCGIGDNARALSGLGYRVTAISPDANHGRYVAADPRIEFVQTRFEDFTTDRRFDLVLMSESQNYFDAAEGFRLARARLNPDGHLLVSGMFRRAGSTRFAQTRNDEREYLEVARREGLEVRSRADITANVLPTLVLARAKYADHLKPAIDLAVQYVRGSRSWKVRLLRRLLARRIDDLASIRRYYEDFFDPALFQQHVVYATILLSPRDAAAGTR